MLHHIYKTFSLLNYCLSLLAHVSVAMEKANINEFASKKTQISHYLWHF